MDEKMNIFCPGCGTKLPADARFCASCGTSIPGDTPAAPSAQQRVGATGSNESSAKRRWLISGAIGAVAVVGAIAAFTVLGGRSSSSEILLGMIDRDGQFDVHLLDVTEDPTRDNRVLDEIDGLGTIEVRNDVWDLGGDVYTRAAQNGDSWLVRYFIDGHAETNVATISGTEVDRIHDTDGTSAQHVWDPSGNRLEIIEYGSSGRECYLSDGVESSDRVSRSDHCAWVGRGILVTADDQDEELQLEVEFPDGVTYQLDVRDYGGRFSVSPDGRYASVAVRDSFDEMRVEFFLLETGEQVSETPDMSDLWWTGPMGTTGSKLFATLVDEDGDRTLFIFDPAQPDLLEIDDGTWLATTGDESTAFVRTVSNDRVELSALSLETYDMTEIARSNDWLSWALVPGNRVIAVDSSGDVIVGNATGESFDLGRLNTAEYGNTAELRLFGESTVLVTTTDDDGERHIDVIDLADNTMTELVSGWTIITTAMATPDGSYVVFAGDRRDYDDVALFAVKGDGSESPHELDDDADLYWDLTLDGGTVYYSAVIGEDPDDVEVRRVDITGNEDPETLYEEARILAAAWDQPQVYLLRGQFEGD